MVGWGSSRQLGLLGYGNAQRRVLVLVVQRLVVVMRIRNVDHIHI